MISDKKICLIVPPSPFLADERVFYFLGVLSISAYWKKLGYVIDVLDLSGIKNYLEAVEIYLNKNDRLHFIGLTGTSPQYSFAHNIGQFIKKNYNHKLVLGGTHATLSHTSYKRDLKLGRVGSRAKVAVDTILSVFDVLVAGDGEYALPDILKIDKGVVDGDDRTSSLFLKDDDLSSIPFPDRDLIDLDSYHYSIDGFKATNVQFQKFCPFGCLFCSARNSPSFRVRRNRTIQSCVDELEYLYKRYGFRGFNILDDELNVNKSIVPFMYAIADLQNKLGVEFRLRGFTKSELFTEEQAKSMYLAGFRVLLTGFESGSDRILENIQKQATKDDNTRCIEIAHKFGLKSKALLSSGHPGESYETIQETKDWVLSVNPSDFDLTIISNYPGAPYYDDAVKDGDRWTYTCKNNGDKQYQKEIDYSKEANYYKGLLGSYVSYTWTDFLSPQQLVDCREEFEKDVRSKLNIAYNPSADSVQFEHSMGSSANILPDYILRSTLTHQPPETVQNPTPPQPELPVEHQPVISKRKLSVVQ